MGLLTMFWVWAYGWNLPRIVEWCCYCWECCKAKKKHINILRVLSHLKKGTTNESHGVLVLGMCIRKKLPAFSYIFSPCWILNKIPWFYHYRSKVRGHSSLEFTQKELPPILITSMAFKPNLTLWGKKESPWRKCLGSRILISLSSF